MKKIINQEQWVMLPTDRSPITLHSVSERLHFIGTMKEDYINSTYHTPQHLYLTSDDEIKGGKEVYYIDKFTNKVTSSGGAEYGEKQNVIIATTDKSLNTLIAGGGEGNAGMWKLFPQIPESFIKYYVEKQGKVGDVEVEIFNPAGGMIGALKLTENNEIIIDIPAVEEKMYSRDDMFPYIFKAMSDCMDEFHPHDDLEPFVTKWIKENL
jgi:hypothetical protein